MYVPETLTDRFPLSCGAGRTGAIIESRLKAAMLIISQRRWPTDGKWHRRPLCAHLVTGFFLCAHPEKANLAEAANVIVGVDLGIGNDAVCSAMLPDGTVTARRFIRLADEKDRLEHLNTEKRHPRAQSGRYASLSHINTKILGTNMNITY